MANDTNIKSKFFGPNAKKSAIVRSAPNRKPLSFKKGAKTFMKLGMTIEKISLIYSAYFFLSFSKRRINRTNNLPAAISCASFLFFAIPTDRP